MKQTEDNEKDSGAPRHDAPAGGGGPDREDLLVAGSPRNLVPIAMAVLLLFFAGTVFYISTVFAQPDEVRDNWYTAVTVLSYLASAVFYAGVVVGLGTLATARAGDRMSAATGVAKLLSWAGAVVVALGVVQSVCIVGAGVFGGWRQEATQIAVLMAHRVFEGGVLAGLALLCLRRVKGAQGL